MQGLNNTQCVHVDKCAESSPTRAMNESVKRATLETRGRRWCCCLENGRAIRLTIGSRSFAQSRGVFLVGLEEPLERSGV